MKKVFIILILVYFGGLTAAVSPVMAQQGTFALGNRITYDGLVDCDGVVGKVLDKYGKPTDTAKPGEEGRQQRCDFAALMRTVNKMINWMFYIAVPLATVLFAYAGLLYIRGTSGARTQANKIFTSVGIGFIIMLVAWISVRTVVGLFVKDSVGATIFLGK